MKILMVNKFLYPKGGSESYMLKLADQLTKLGHQVEFFGMYDRTNTRKNSLALYTTNMDFHEKRLSRFLYPFKIIYSHEAYKKIGYVLDAFKPDIVHMNNINFQLTPSIIYAIKKRNIPLVQTVHDYQMICPNHLFYSFSENKPCERCLTGSKLNCFKHSCIHDSKIKSLIGVMEAKFYETLKTYKKVDLFICPSKFLERKLLASKSFYKGKTFTIHNFIEKCENLKITKPDKPYVVFVGRLSKEKGVELLSKAAKLVPDIKFVVAGDGPDKDVLKGLPNVELKGFVGGEALNNLIANASLLVAPSVCYENCPLSILEAHSMGVPVVTMQSGGMAELVEDGVTGTLVPSPDAKSLADALLKTLKDEEYYKKLKENCKFYSRYIMGVEEYTQLLVKKYNELLSGR